MTSSSASRGTTGYSLDEILRRPAREHREAAQAGGASTLQEGETAGGVVRDDRCRSRTKRGSDGALLTRRDVERSEREPGTVLGERASGGRKAFLLGERLLERADALAHERRAFGEPGALPLGRCAPPLPCAPPRARGAASRVAVRRDLVPRSLGPEPLDQRRRRLHPQLEPLDAALQPIARRNRRLTAPRRVRELLLGASTIREHSLEPPLRASFRER